MVGAVLPARADFRPLSFQERVASEVDLIRDDDGVMAQLLRNYLPRSTPPKLMRQYEGMLRGLLGDAGFRRQFTQVVAFSLKNGYPDRRVAALWLVDTLHRGLRRLDEGNMTVAYAFYARLLWTVSEGECAAMLRWDPLVLAESGRFETQALQSLPTAGQAAYFRMARTAILDEVHQRPGIHSLSKKQMQSVDARLRQLMARRKGGRTPVAYLTAAVRDPWDAPDRQVCAMGRQTVSAMLRLPEPQRRWGLSGNAARIWPYSNHLAYAQLLAAMAEREKRRASR